MSSLTTYTVLRQGPRQQTEKGTLSFETTMKPRFFDSLEEATRFGRSVAERNTDNHEERTYLIRDSRTKEGKTLITWMFNKSGELTEVPVE